MKQMTYETTDWELEARRIAAAFGVVGECEFQTSGLTQSLRFREANGTFNPILTVAGDNFATVGYSASGRRFSIASDHISIDSEQETRIQIGWDGAVLRVSRWFGEAEALAKALLHLGLLTPDIEAALEVDIPADEKAEWAVEYAEQCPLETLDWQGEAKRVARAFGVWGECDFWPCRESGIHYQRGMRLHERLKSQFWYEYPAIAEGVHLSCHYYLTHRSFSVANRDKRVESQIMIGWDGRFDSLVKNGLERELASGLFRLGLLTEEIEAALKVTITAHQKAEWLGEYETNDL